MSPRTKSLPPTKQDLEVAERAILGAVLLQNSKFDCIDLSADDFYDPRHQVIFRTIHDLAKLDQPFDVKTLKQELEYRGDLAKCGGAEYLASLTTAVPRGFRISSGCAIVDYKASERELRDRCFAVLKHR
jgi:replicative DNA helicase